MRTTNAAYVLGHSGTELDRLISQARFFGDLTAQVLHSAGVTKGMRVLDVGCGPGDVSFLASTIVGPTGTVVGVDNSADAVSLASQRALQARLSNVRFVAGDLQNLTSVELNVAEPFDAIVGRLVLMYFADPGAVLRELLGLLRPGGVVAFHEMDASDAKSEPRCELFERTLERIRETFRRAHIDAQTGLRFPRIFRSAGLGPPHMILGARIECGPHSAIYAQLVQITRTLAPLMERTGVATADAAYLDALEDQLREEAVARNAVVISPSLVGAWGRKP
jgi:ubiquinone/menaquinone biosynthesis C-methylase UbiE